MSDRFRTIAEMLMVVAGAITFAIAVDNRNTTIAVASGVMVVVFTTVLFYRQVATFRLPTFSRHTRITLATTGVWILALQLWGFIWGWHRHFDGLQFFVLHLAVPVLTWAAWRGYRWVTATR